MSLNTQTINATGLNASPAPVIEESTGGQWVKVPTSGGLNSGGLNTRTINGPGYRWVYVPGEAEEVVPEFALRTVYLLEIDGVRVPMSSFQATMRTTGQSYLQAIIPDGSSHLDALTQGAPMRVLMGLLRPDDSVTSTEEIAGAPLQIIRHDQGASRDTLSISGYGPAPSAPSGLRALRGVSSRTINQGVRRVRCEVDLLLRPGQLAVDSDGASFIVSTIQYFVGARNENMEVLEDG